MTDAEPDVRELLERLIAKDADEPCLTATERIAFEAMSKQVLYKRLSLKQVAWIQDAAERHGIIGAAPSANLFSALDPAAQREHRARARAVVLPHETPGYMKILKPPPGKPDE